MFFIYILYSESKNSYYTGYSEDPQRRLGYHNQGSTTSTKSGIPWKIVYTETFNTKSEAIKRERFIKRMKSRVFIEKLINSKN